MRYLIDTDICSYALKGDQRIVLKWRPLSPVQVRISVVTEAELRYGARRRSSKFQRQVDQFLRTMNVLVFGSEVTRTYADLRYSLDRAGKPIGVFDLVIAAQAIANDLVLVTNNEREFRRVPGLKIENWAA
jgi:tRNA(fMet)-specific endonuclease VapC